MTIASPCWFDARLASRTGAAHVRQSIPCQDACGWQAFRDQSGETVQVLVVSDGHGGKRYRRSDAGSRLACAVALQEVKGALTAAATRERPASDGTEGAQRWEDWLGRELPGRIVRGWYQEVERHWSNHPEGGEAVFSSVPYGATLGLLLLTPHWWGHTGLGDWDLVRLPASGPAELLSEEPAREGGGEATFSLCMEHAQDHFLPRSGWHPLSPSDPSFQLLLSTDGIRKSCGSDADFLLLARHLAALTPGPGMEEDPELAAALDHISREGSGDDVSVAISSWGCGARRPVAGDRVVLQPHPPAEAPDLLPRDEPSPNEGPAPWVSSSTGGQRAAGGRRWWVAALAGAALAAVGGGIIAHWQGMGPFAAASKSLLLTAEQRQSIRWQVDQLCGTPASPAGPANGRAQRIRAMLQQRRQTFEGLAEGDPRMLREELQRDPLSALIALSRLSPSAKEAPGAVLELGPDSTVPLCQELRGELNAQWARVRKESVGAQGGGPR